jgi:hypothetical protein
MASSLTSRPTYAKLEKKFQKSAINLSENIDSIRTSVDWALFQQPSDLREFVTDLRADGIEVVIPPLKDGAPLEHIYVDHQTHTAVTGKTIGQAYTAETIQKTLLKGRSHSPGQTSQHISHPYTEKFKIGDRGFNSRVPQVLSDLFESFSGQDEKHQGHYFGRGYKR